MSESAHALLSLTVLAAALGVVHVMLLIRAARSALGNKVRALALIPPATPVIAWKAGARLLPIVWVALALAYVVVRLRAP